MKNIKLNFSELQEKYPNHSSHIVFGRAITGKHYSRDIIRRWFNVLVDKDDYDLADKRMLLEILYRRSNPSRTSRIGGKEALGR